MRILETRQDTPTPMPLPAYQVTRFCRRSRRTLAVCAEGVTMDAARALAARLRADDAENEHVHGYTVASLPLRRQAELAEAAGLMSHAAGPAPYNLAA